MGGLAFANAIGASGQPALNVKRLNAAQYAYTGEHCRMILAASFPDAVVDTPCTFPSKTAHGDVDIHLSTSHKVDWSTVAAKLGAKGWVNRGSSKLPCASFAVRLDGKRESQCFEYRMASEHAVPNPDVTEAEYAQVDVAHLPEETLSWRSFYDAYSDVGTIIGRISRRFGFKFSSQCLSLELDRLWDFKKADINIADSEATLYLSTSVPDVVRWLGLDLERFHQGFGDTEELYDWLENCLFLRKDVPLRREEAGKERLRCVTRPVFAGFMDRQYARQSQEPINEAVRSQVRQQLQLDAVVYFGKQDEHAELEATLERRWANLGAQKELKELLLKLSGVTDKNVLSYLRGFRRYVVAREGRPVLTNTPHTDHESQLYHFFDPATQSLQPDFVVWVQEHYVEVKDAAKKVIRSPHVLDNKDRLQNEQDVSDVDHTA